MESIDKFDVALLGSDSESTGLDREHREPPTRYGHQDIERKNDLKIFTSVVFAHWKWFGSRTQVYSLTVRLEVRLLEDKKHWSVKLGKLNKSFFKERSGFEFV